jgi:hypothetical protein
VQAAYFAFFVDMIEVYLPIAVTGARTRLFPPAFGAAQATLFYVVLAISLTLLHPKEAVKYTLDVVHVALINVLARLEVITENRSARSSHHP